MAGIGTINLKVLLFDSDFYALQSINGYLAWDRRTRVSFMSEEISLIWGYLEKTPQAEMPDVIVMDAEHFGGVEPLRRVLRRMRGYVPDVRIICLSQIVHPELVEAAADEGATAFFLKQELRFRIAWAIVYALDRDFVMTSGVAKACARSFNTRIFHAAVLPEQREYPELTHRIRQAIQLCVVEGMPAHLAADEMGISLHTIRGYIKEGYRILEAYDATEYPVDMTPQERAFMRFTALADDDGEDL